MANVKKSTVFISTFSLVCGGLLLGKVFYEKLLFKSSVTVNFIEYDVNPGENILTYRMNYSVKNDNPVSIRVRNEFFNVTNPISEGIQEDYYVTGYFAHLTPHAKYKVEILEKGIAVHTETVKLKSK